ERRNDVALRIEGDEPGLGGRAQMLGAGGEPQTVGKEIIGGVDEGDLDRAVAGPPASGEGKRQERKGQPAHRHKALLRPGPMAGNDWMAGSSGVASNPPGSGVRSCAGADRARGPPAPAHGCG